MRLQQSGGFDLSTLSVEQLTDMMKNKALAQLAPAIQAELNERTKPKALLTLTVLKNFRAKPVLDKEKEPTGMFRVQALVQSAKFVNPQKGSELTLGGGDNNSVANISVFLLFDEEQLDKLDKSQTSAVTVEIALSKHPEDDTKRYALAIGTIQELKTVYNETRRINETFLVWENDAKEQYLGDKPPTGFVPVMEPTYGTRTVVSHPDDIIVEPIDLNAANAIIPTDLNAWVAEQNARSKIKQAQNLANYMVRQKASTDAIVNDTLKDAASIPSKEEEDVAIAI
jgi:hypothetical protein